jgi:hypothetical protein
MLFFNYTKFPSFFIDFYCKIVILCERIGKQASNSLSSPTLKMSGFPLALYELFYIKEDTEEIEKVEVDNYGITVRIKQ